MMKTLGAVLVLGLSSGALQGADAMVGVATRGPVKGHKNGSIGGAKLAIEPGVMAPGGAVKAALEPFNSGRTDTDLRLKPLDAPRETRTGVHPEQSWLAGQKKTWTVDPHGEAFVFPFQGEKGSYVMITTGGYLIMRDRIHFGRFWPHFSGNLGRWADAWPLIKNKRDKPEGNLDLPRLVYLGEGTQLTRYIDFTKPFRNWVVEVDRQASINKANNAARAAVKGAKTRNPYLNETSLKSLGTQAYGNFMQLNKNVLNLWLPTWLEGRKPTDATAIDGMVNQLLGPWFTRANFSGVKVQAEAKSKLIKKLLA